MGFPEKAWNCCEMQWDLSCNHLKAGTEVKSGKQDKNLCVLRESILVSVWMTGEEGIEVVTASEVKNGDSVN